MISIVEETLTVGKKYKVRVEGGVTDYEAKLLKDIGLDNANISESFLCEKTYKNIIIFTFIVYEDEEIMVIEKIVEKNKQVQELR